MQSRYFTINDFPQGTPGRELFELRETELPALAEGEVRIRNTWLSLDPYMRGRMSGVKTYIAPFVLGEPLEGAAVGEVIESRDARLAVGDRVRHMAGWRDIAQLPGDQVEPLPGIEVPDRAALSIHEHAAAPQAAPPTAMAGSGETPWARAASRSAARARWKASRCCRRAQ